MSRSILPVLFALLTAQTLFADEAAPSTERIQMTPDMVELIVQTDTKAQGFLARNHHYQVQFDLDPIITGRMTLGFQLRLNKFLTLDIPVSYENSAFGQWGGRILGFYPKGTANSGLMGGVGLKIRISEWLGKGSFYVEPLIQATYFSEVFNSGNKEASSIRIRPAVYLGYEAVLDSGLVLGAKFGVEKPFDIVLDNTPSPMPFAIVPMLSIGYAW
jgi:hypothetical protein